MCFYNTLVTILLSSGLLWRVLLCIAKSQICRRYELLTCISWCDGLCMNGLLLLLWAGFFLLFDLSWTLRAFWTKFRQRWIRYGEKGQFFNFNNRWIYVGFIYFWKTYFNRKWQLFLPKIYLFNDLFNKIFHWLKQHWPWISLSFLRVIPCHHMKRSN